MNKSQRIHLTTDNSTQDKHIIIKLEQDITSLEFLSMNIGTTEAYQNFNADYGVLVGRVIANGGVGIENAKISIFIPLSEEDENNSDIKSIYPYKTPRDKNVDGKRYNLLPRVAKRNPTTKVVSPKQPFGSFPIKEEIVTNEVMLNVYKKYYKYTAVTNKAGDYMIFGVPVGTQTVHLSVDITDIGKYSMTPAAMVTNLGYSPNLFTNNNSKIKPSNDLNDLPHIETQEISVNIIPFWGDTENFEIGITQQNFRIRSTLVNTFCLFGSAFTDGDNSMWGEQHYTGRAVGELYRAKNDANNTVGIYSKRAAKVTEKIYYYPNTVTDARINAGLADPTTEMLILDPSEYSVYKKGGDFVFIVNCNRNKVITDEFGNEVSTDENSTNGVFTKFRGFVTLEISEDEVPMNFMSNLGGTGGDTVMKPLRERLKFPQYADRNKGFSRFYNNTDSDETKAWRKQHIIFESGKFYSFSRFHGIVADSFSNKASDSDFHYDNGFWNKDSINNTNNDQFFNVGIIVTNDYQSYTNSIYQFPSNTTYGTLNSFGANWLNLSVYLPQVGYIENNYAQFDYLRIATQFAPQVYQDNSYNMYFLFDNTQEIAAGDFNTKWFARSDLHWTDIIEVPLTDIQSLKNTSTKGFTSNAVAGLTGKYRNGTYKPSGWTSACPINGGKNNGLPTNAADTKTYFYKGHGDCNIIDFLYQLGIIT